MYVAPPFEQTIIRHTQGLFVRILLTSIFKVLSKWCLTIILTNYDGLGLGNHITLLCSRVYFVKFVHF